MKKLGQPSRHLVALAGYAALALLYTYPLARHFSTHCLGPEVDAPFWTWSMWYFRYAATTLHSTPFWTDMIYWPYGANLVLQAGLFYNLAGFYLQTLIGLTATFNLLLLQTMVLGGYGVFLIASEWGASWGAAFTAGALYAFAPDSAALLDWGVAFDHMSRQVLPFFVWAMSRAVRRGRFWDAALAALALTWAWGCDYYLFLFCLLLIPLFFFVLQKPLNVKVSPRPARTKIKITCRILDALLLVDVLWVARALYNGQTEFHGHGDVKTLLLYVTPYLLFWALLALRLAARYTARLRIDRRAFSLPALFPYAATLGSYLLLNLPLVATVLVMMKSGDYGAPSSSWRGGGNPTDVGLFLRPSYLHPLWGHLVNRVFGDSPATAYLGFLPPAAAFWLWRQRPKDPWVRLWLAGAAFSFLMNLGPWLKVFGMHTYFPLPFYFTHLLPVFNNIQTGQRFTVCTMLFLALLFAAALREMSSRLPAASARRLPLLAFVLIAFEFAHKGLPLHSSETPALFHRLGDRPDGAILPVPFGAIFDGISAHGCLGQLSVNPRDQIVHHKPYMGGLIGRMPRRVYDQMRADPFISSLASAQSGSAPSTLLRDPVAVVRYFRQTRLRYVLVYADKTPPALREAIKRWPLQLVDVDQGGRLQLYVVKDSRSI